MDSKQEYRASIKTARKELRNKRKLARTQYKFEARKHKLLLKQAEAKKGLKEMGVPNRQIPVQIISRTQNVTVRVA